MHYQSGFDVVVVDDHEGSAIIKVRNVRQSHNDKADSREMNENKSKSFFSEQFIRLCLVKGP